MPTVLKDKAILHSLFVLLIANDFCFAASEVSPREADNIQRHN